MGVFSPLLVIGAGNMGGAILRSWLEAGRDQQLDLRAGDIYVEDPARQTILPLC